MIYDSTDEQASAYACSFINGNRERVCLEILAGPNPAVMASMVTMRLAKNGGSFDDAGAFIRILDSVIENASEKIVTAINIDTVNM